MSEVYQERLFPVEKRCTKCGRLWPLDPKYFNRARKGKYGYVSHCRVCLVVDSRREWLLLQLQAAKGIRVCTKCYEGKPLTADFFPYAKNPNRPKQIFRAECKDCTLARYKLYREENQAEIAERRKKEYWDNREAHLQYHKDWRKKSKAKGITGYDGEPRTCQRCEQTYPATPEHFPLGSNRLDGLSGWCVYCHRAWNVEWYCENKNTHNENQREWYLRNREWHLERTAQNRRENPELYNEFSRRYRAKYPERVRARNHILRAKIAAVEGRFDEIDILEMLENQEGKCCYCEVSLDDGYQVDHVVPLALGGVNDWTNLALACAPCNASKGAKPLTEWWEWRKRK